MNANKKLTLIIIIVIAIILFAGGVNTYIYFKNKIVSPSETPAEVVKNFYDYYLSNYISWAEIQKNPQTQKAFDPVPNGVRNPIPTHCKIAQDAPSSITPQSTIISGDTAKVIASNNWDETLYFILKNKNGEWKIFDMLCSPDEQRIDLNFFYYDETKIETAKDTCGQDVLSSVKTYMHAEKDASLEEKIKDAIHIFMIAYLTDEEQKAGLSNKFIQLITTEAACEDCVSLFSNDALRSVSLKNNVLEVNLIIDSKIAGNLDSCQINLLKIQLKKIAEQIAPIKEIGLSIETL